MDGTWSLHVYCRPALASYGSKRESSVQVLCLLRSYTGFLEPEKQCIPAILLFPWPKLSAFRNSDSEGRNGFRIGSLGLLPLRKGRRTRERWLDLFRRLALTTSALKWAPGCLLLYLKERRPGLAWWCVRLHPSGCHENTAPRTWVRSGLLPSGSSPAFKRKIASGLFWAQLLNTSSLVAQR